MTPAQVGLIGDALAWAMAASCLCLVAINAYAILRDRRSPYAASRTTQGMAALYAGVAFAIAALEHERVGVIDGRTAILVVILASIADRIVHARMCK